MSIITVGHIEVSKFIVTSGGKRGLWVKAQGYNADVDTEDGSYFYHRGNTQFIAINPQGRLVKWDELPTGSGYYNCTQFVGSKRIECSPELITEYMYDNKAAEMRLLRLLKDTAV